MADIFSKEKRSEVMSRIRPTKTKPELQVFRFLRREKIPFRMHYKGLPGRPDAVILNKRVAIFVDGDFWHGWQFGKWGHKLPRKYWQQKIKDNIARDKRTFARIRYRGWKVVRIWEHQLTKRECERTFTRLRDLLI